MGGIRRRVLRPEPGLLDPIPLPESAHASRRQPASLVRRARPSRRPRPADAPRPPRDLGPRSLRARKKSSRRGEPGELDRPRRWRGSKALIRRAVKLLIRRGRPSPLDRPLTAWRWRAMQGSNTLEEATAIRSSCVLDHLRKPRGTWVLDPCHATGPSRHCRRGGNGGRMHGGPRKESANGNRRIAGEGSPGTPGGGRQEGKMALPRSRSAIRDRRKGRGSERLNDNKNARVLEPRTEGNLTVGGCHRLGVEGDIG